MPWRPFDDLLALVELAAPSACAGCGAVGTRWCAACQEELTGSPPRSWRPTPCPPGLPPTWSGPPYDGAVRAAVVAWKEEGRVDLTPRFAEVLRGTLRAALAGSAPHGRATSPSGPTRTGRQPSVLLVPAPSGRSSSRARGRRPVTELARAAARGTPGVALSEALRLGRPVRDQAGLDAAERARNLAGAVHSIPGLVPALRGVPCVIVDDVVTTGATLQDCARALREAGSGPVIAVTLAATRRRWHPPLPSARPAD